jgi:hypothetical protein
MGVEDLPYRDVWILRYCAAQHVIDLCQFNHRSNVDIPHLGEDAGEA